MAFAPVFRECCRFPLRRGDLIDRPGSAHYGLPGLSIVRDSPVAVLQLPQVELHGKTGGGSGGERLLGRFGISLVATAVRHEREVIRGGRSAGGENRYQQRHQQVSSFHSGSLAARIGVLRRRRGEGVHRQVAFCSARVRCYPGSRWKLPANLDGRIGGGT